MTGPADFYAPSERDVALEIAHDEWRALVAGEEGLAFPVLDYPTSFEAASWDDPLPCGCMVGEGCPRCSPEQSIGWAA